MRFTNLLLINPSVFWLTLLLWAAPLTAMETQESCSLKLTALYCDYDVNPLGIDDKIPYLSWTLQSSQRGARQSACRILVASSPAVLAEDRGDLWDSGKMNSSQSVHIPYTGKSPNSRQRCYWKVCVWDENGCQSNWSPPSWWEMGLIQKSDWQAQWIGAPYHTEENGGGPAPYFRKSFQLPAGIRTARAYICGLGYFELHLNGRKVGDDVLVPHQTDYSLRPNLQNKSYPYEDNGVKRVLYLTYDVTGYLTAGENVIGVILGSGFYHNRRDVEGNHNYGSPRVLCQLEIQFNDGSFQTIASGVDWKASRGPIEREDIYNGEYYDATWERPGWDNPNYDDTKEFRGSRWEPARLAQQPTGRLEAQTAPSDKVVETLKPVTIQRLKSKPDTYLVDFGQNFTGWVKFRVQGTQGHRIELTFGEEFNGQDLDRTYDRPISTY